MKRFVVFGTSACALSLAVAVQLTAQQGKPADPRVGLKAGLRDAGKAAWHLELVASMQKPPGFFDPASPAGDPTAPEKDPTGRSNEDDQPAKPDAEPPPAASRSSGLNFANSDLAFKGEHLFAGNFNGFNTYDIEDPKHARLIASVVCPGGQGDVSVYGNLLIMSVEQTRGRVDCGTGGVEAPVSGERFRGVRVFDITDVRKPRQVAAVQTCRGSHTHTLVTDPKDKDNLYVYGSGTSTVRSGDELAGCSSANPKDDPNTALFSIDVIQVPLAAPEKSRIVNRPRIFSDPATGAIAGLNPGGSQGPGAQPARVTNQCHDITVFPELGLAAGACAGNGILLDISDPVRPVRLDAVSDKNFAYWHSATFNNDGTKVIFTDEWGGGTRPRCRAIDPPTWGADAIFDVVDRKLRFGGYYKMPAPQTDQENCVAHNGSLIPVPGRDIMVQAWYQGGLSVFDFTDSTKPFEIAYFDRGPLDAKQLFTAGYWSTYLVQRAHLRHRDRARAGRLQADGERIPDRERDRCRPVREARYLQRAAADARDLDAEPGGREGVPRSADAEQGHRRRARRGSEDRHRARRQGAQREGSRRAGGGGAVEDADGTAGDGCRGRHRPRRRPSSGARRDVERTRGGASVDGRRQSAGGRSAVG